VTIGLFEATKTIGQALANIFYLFILYQYELRIFNLNESFQGTCFGHVFPKVCKYLKMYNLVLKVYKRQTRMEQGMFKFKYSPKKIEYSNENRVNNIYISFLFI
jgi:hypothetical protein